MMGPQEDDQDRFDLDAEERDGCNNDDDAAAEHHQLTLEKLYIRERLG